ncbi:HTH-type transcriptional regulator DmlR [Sinobacterium norvegicum]|uniref:HTH-type transcriptional regulator DmlR n=1 Tax=Sinobacterium norvegicum TaxID=1641715 RepID=A0ABM9AEH0_9GAMM|nr:LysR family transcriptional regulator [Sinobacterium norvegicum]CAH0991096.1 HTH-type transcriptional regulator DmlR [Sinobacterium norvegicum]
MKDSLIIIDNMLLADLDVIVKIAECRSITAAATLLDMRVATASAALKRVEKSLGAELFVRTTRRLRLSAAGERYLPQCQLALETLAQARQNMQQELDIIEGELRLALPSDLGRNIISPWLDELLATHPKLSLRTNLSDSHIDFYRDAVDVALRYGSPKDSSLYGFKICTVPGVLCASPDYLSRCGTPTQPQDLLSHNGLFYQLYDMTHDVWQFSHDGRSQKIKMSGNRASNDGDQVRRWCIDGQGVAIKSCLDMSTDLLNKKVVNVMPDYRPKASELWLICPSRQSITPAVRLLRDTLQQHCAALLKALASEGILSQEQIR